MRTLLQTGLLVLFASAMVGCGAPEVDEEANEQMEQLENDPSYEEQMQGGMQSQ